LKALVGRVADVATVTIPGEANSLSAEDAAAAASSVGLAAKSFPSVSAAVAAASGKPGPRRILICGSLYLAGTVLAENG
jgi:dihydrofolate synthase/folylpolyglutamate synthase